MLVHGGFFPPQFLIHKDPQPNHINVTKRKLETKENTKGEPNQQQQKQQQGQNTHYNGKLNLLCVLPFPWRNRPKGANKHPPRLGKENVRSTATVFGLCGGRI
tara:strand:- start:41 stop:349 length:309 start_codon:yes stop_codon:yes gene_type:complete